MPRGGKTKTLEEKISTGTLRNNVHAKQNNTDSEKLEQMKITLFNLFNKTTTRLENIDIDKSPEAYKQLNSAMLEQIKTFYNITKFGGLKENDKEENKKIDIASFK